MLKQAFFQQIFSPVVQCHHSSLHFIQQCRAGASFPVSAVSRMWPALVFASSVITRAFALTLTFAMVPVVTGAAVVLVFHVVTVTGSFARSAASSAPWSPPFVAMPTRLTLSVSIRPELRNRRSSATFVLSWRWAVAAVRAVRSWVAPSTKDKRTSCQQQKKQVGFKQPGVQV